MAGVLKNLQENLVSIEAFADCVLGCDEAAEQLRKYTMLDCLFD
jgi:hypothetical protein